MAVNVTSNGGIYIEISGDYSQLRQELASVRNLAKSEGKAISDALSGAMDKAGGNILKQARAWIVYGAVRAHGWAFWAGA